MGTKTNLLLSSACAFLCSISVAAAQVDEANKEGNPPEPAVVRLAVFDIDVVGGLETDAAAITDQVVAMFSAADGVALVNRDQLSKVAEEHKIALSGLVDNASAVQLGKFVSAQYVVVGRASRIGEMRYLLIKFIQVETTVQSTLTAKAHVRHGLDGLLKQLREPLSKRLAKLRQPAIDGADAELAELRRQMEPLREKVFLVSIDEQHLGRPLADPAAQMAIVKRLQRLGLKVIVPHQPVDGWKKSLARQGRYADEKVDFLVEGEGISAFAAELQGLTSCRARVELRLVALPGHVVQLTDRGIGARADLVEAFAAKAALEDAAIDAIDAVLPRLADVHDQQ